MYGQIEHEAELNVAASETWDLYSSLQMGKLLEKELPMLQKVEVIEGDGGVGTVQKVTFKTDLQGQQASCKEKFTKIDDKNMIMEVEIVEGWYLEKGFTSFRTRYQVIEKGEDSSFMKSTMDYEFKEEAAPIASLVHTEILESFAQMALIAQTHLNKNKLPTKEDK